MRALKRKKPIIDNSSSDEDVPLASSSPVKTAAIPLPGAIQAVTVPTNGKTKANGKAKRVGSDEEDDKPLTKPKHTSKAPPKKKLKTEDTDDGSDDDDKPITKKKAPAKKRKVKEESDAEDSADDKPLKKSAAKKSRAKKVKDEDASGSEAPKPKKRATKAKKEETDASPKKTAKQKKEEEEEEIHRWWDQQQEGDSSEKWQTLQHNGVYFPPAYEPLPRNVKMKYDGIYLPAIPQNYAKYATSNRKVCRSVSRG